MPQGEQATITAEYLQAQINNDGQWPMLQPHSAGANLNWMDWENIMQEIFMVPGDMDSTDIDMPVFPTDLALENTDAPSQSNSDWSFPP